MLAVAALSLLVAIMGVAGSATMVSDGLGITRIGSATGTPAVGSSSAPPPAGANLPVVLLGIARGVLSLLLAIGAIGTLGVRPAGRWC